MGGLCCAQRRGLAARRPQMVCVWGLGGGHQHPPPPSPFPRAPYVVCYHLRPAQNVPTQINGPIIMLTATRTRRGDHNESGCRHERRGRGDD
jgi:hypothetical protein